MSSTENLFEIVSNEICESPELESLDPTTMVVRLEMDRVISRDDVDTINSEQTISKRKLVSQVKNYPRKKSA